VCVGLGLGLKFSPTNQRGFRERARQKARIQHSIQDSEHSIFSERRRGSRVILNHSNKGIEYTESSILFN
jgi:hypothetical protein